MQTYSPEHKEALLKQLLPPINRSVSELAQQERIPKNTLYSWRIEAKRGKKCPPAPSGPAERWAAEIKLAIVIETASLSAVELNEYCRAKGLYPEQVNRWRQAFVAVQHHQQVDMKAQSIELKAANKRIKELERELRRKEKALAETAALLVLRKKLNAYWEQENEDS
jgi:transposase-like protein